MARYTLCLFLSLGFLIIAPAAFPAVPDDSAFLGRWDITMPAPEAGGRARYCWLELTRDGGQLKGRFNSGGGAVFDLPEVTIENGELKFQYPQGRPPSQTTAVYRAAVKNGKLEGTAVLGKETRSWTGVPGPKWPSVLPKRNPGKPVDLFNGKDIRGWVGQVPGRPLNWKVVDGILVNEPPANNIYSEQKFQDFKVEVEFMVDKGSNSGLYLRGRYEIQIMDGQGRPLNVHSQGALYGFVVPPKDYSKAPGEWQTMEVTLIQNRVTVVHNGVTIMENAEVPGITGGALDANEGEPGPIMLQGDHGKVQFRRIRVTPLI